MGAAATLAAQGRNLAQVGFVMVLFGLGAGLQLAVVGSVSRAAMIRLRGKMLATGTLGKSVLRMVLLMIGVLILTGIDKRLEPLAVDHSPTRLTDLRTRY